MYIFLHFVVLIICNICLLFALLFKCMHVDCDVTNVSFYLRLFLYIPIYVLKYSYFN